MRCDFSVASRRVPQFQQPAAADVPCSHIVATLLPPGQNGSTRMALYAPQAPAECIYFSERRVARVPGVKSEFLRK